jgi:hypothetical protein
MLVVAGLSLKNLQPRVWDPSSPYFLSNLQAVMVSYADFERRASRRRAAMAVGLHAFLDVPSTVQVYLDNGAFYHLGQVEEAAHAEYEQFVTAARPDWWPIPQDFIPIPTMTLEEQRACLEQTMRVNRDYQHDGYVPVMHLSRVVDEYIAALLEFAALDAKPAIAVGGIVPNLLRAPSAQPYADVIRALREVRAAFPEKRLHVFGVGGTATLHLMALLKFNSVDSSGWRNRAARGIIQLPGSGDRMVSNLGSWRGREPSPSEWRALETCPCPACRLAGIEGLRASGLIGFCNRATHNLAVLLREAEAIEARLADGSYASWYESHLSNSTYLPLIRQALKDVVQTMNPRQG